MRPLGKRPFRYLSLSTIIVSALILASCGPAEFPLTTFSREGYESAQILNLFWPIFWLAIAVFIIVEGALIYSIVRYRRRPEDGIPVQLHGNTPVELGWTIAPAILVLIMAVMTFRTQALIERQPVDPIRVTVIGHQWWWEFQYPDFNIVTANELHVPVDRDIEFTLLSADVIHSFWFPRLAGKTDVIPGHENKLVMRPLEAQNTLIRGHCAEFCGGTHAMMAMHVAVRPQADFDAWVQLQQQAAPVPVGVEQAAAADQGAAVGATVEAEVTAIASEGDDVAATTVATVEPTANAPTDAQQVEGAASLEAAGYQLFQTKGCIGCHAITGYPGAVSRVGPDLTHVGSRQHIVAGWIENTPENMQRWLRNPGEVKPENVMANVIRLGTLTEDEIDALTAYLLSLK